MLSAPPPLKKSLSYFSKRYAQWFLTGLSVDVPIRKVLAAV